ncbi:MAG: hypothetical protein IJQ25_04965 [Oscillibacter sp.]|nr:hypothetical protein [Oscillibacter sp.]
MKRFIILCLSVLVLLSACATATPESVAEPPAPEPDEPIPELEIQPGPDDIDPETGDRVLSSTSATVSDGRTLRLDAVGQALTEPGSSVRYGIREVRVYEGENALQTLVVAHIEGAATTQAPTVESALSARDMNFDGADDIDLYAQVTRSVDPHYYYLWNPDTGLYEYAFTLRGAEVDPDAREIVSTYRRDDGLDCKERLRYNDAGALELVSRVTEDWKNGTEDFPLVDYYEFRDGEAVLVREEFTDYDDGGLTVREVREPVDGELRAVRREVLEGADGEYHVVRTEEVAPEPEFPEEYAAPETLPEEFDAPEEYGDAETFPEDFDGTEFPEEYGDPEA